MNKPNDNQNPSAQPQNTIDFESGRSRRSQNTSFIKNLPNHREGQNYNPQIRAQYANEPDYVHAKRDINIPKFDIDPEIKRRHEESVEKYPDLNLSEAEYVLIETKRHPIGLFLPIIACIFICIVVLSGMFIYHSWYNQQSLQGSIPNPSFVYLISILSCGLVAAFTYIASWVYLRNRFFMTNESVIQEIQHSIFSKHEQTVSLGSIEDVSFTKIGIFQTMFNYGSIRLSTEGEETTYRFHYVENPKDQTAVISNAVEAFKNGRNVGD